MTESENPTPEEIEPLVYSYNGLIRSDNQPFSLDPVTFVTFAAAYHPEWIDDDGMPIVAQIVLTKLDAEILHMPEVEGAVLVTIRPDIDGNKSYATAAALAAERYPFDPKTRAAFITLRQLFVDQGFDHDVA